MTKVNAINKYSTGLKSIKILGVKVSIASEKLVLEKIQEYLKKGGKIGSGRAADDSKTLKIFTPNPEIIEYAQHDSKFREIVNSAQINIPDGSGTVWGIKRLIGIETAKITGIDLMKKLSGYAAILGFRIGLIGAKEGLAINVMDCLSKSYKNLKIVNLGSPTVRIEGGKPAVYNSESYHGGHTSRKVMQSDNNYFEITAKRISKAGIGIVFVALGFPKQEYFINELALAINREKVNNRTVLMGVGGSFDYLAGVIPRAPERMRKIGLEWLYRLIREPRRLSRQLRGGVYFMKVLLSG